MEKKQKIIAIIPARGGSKRIIGKNIKDLAGKPMIAYTIESSIKSKFINRTIVSTDDKEIAKVAKKYGAEVIMRPKELAQDNTPTEPVLIHVVKELEKKGEKISHVVLLQLTSPLRKTKIIDQGIKLAIKSNADSVLSVSEMQHYYLLGHFENDGYKLEYDKRPFSQDMQKKFKENGALYITKKEFLLKNKNRIGGKINAIVMNPIDSMDIDEMSEFEIVEKIIKGDYYERN